MLSPLWLGTGCGALGIGLLIASLRSLLLKDLPKFYRVLWLIVLGDGIALVLNAFYLLGVFE